MIHLLQTAIDSVKTTASLQSSSSYWIWIALGELVIILFLLIKRKSHTSNRQAKQAFKSKALSEEIDFSNVINSSFHANELYDMLKKKCHPDRFTDMKEQEVANQLFQQITQHKRNYKKLRELQQEAIKKLNLNF